MKTKEAQETKEAQNALYDVVMATRPERQITRIARTGVLLKEAYAGLPVAAHNAADIALIVRTGLYRVGEFYVQPAAPSEHHAHARK